MVNDGGTVHIRAFIYATAQCNDGKTVAVVSQLFAIIFVGDMQRL